MSTAVSASSHIPMEMLKGIRFFASLSEAQLADIQAATILLRKDKNAAILMKDSDVLGLYGCIRGEVGVFLEKTQSPLTVLRPPDTFGEVSLLDNRKASATVRALTDDTVLVLIKRDIFLALLSADPNLAAILYREIALDLAHKLRATDDQLATLLHGEK